MKRYLPALAGALVIVVSPLFGMTDARAQTLGIEPNVLRAPDAQSSPAGDPLAATAASADRPDLDAASPVPAESDESEKPAEVLESQKPEVKADLNARLQAIANAAIS